MPIHPSFLVRNAEGIPQPPTDLLERIRRENPGVGLFYTKAQWAITEGWKDDDPRRERIKTGEMQPQFAFDICGYLPITCSLDEAPAYINRELTSWTAEQFKGIRDAVRHWNDVVQPAAQEDLVLGAVSNDLDKSNIVSPGISAQVAIDLKPDKGKKAVA